MAPFFDFLRRSKTKTDGYASEPQSGTDSRLARQRKGKSRIRDSFVADSAWSVQDGRMRPVDAHPMSEALLQPQGCYDGPLPEKHARWNPNRPRTSSNRHDSINSHAPAPFHPPISRDVPYFSYPERQRASSRTGRRSSLIVENRGARLRREPSPAANNGRYESTPGLQQQECYPTYADVNARPASRSSYHPLAPSMKPYTYPFLPDQANGHPFTSPAPPHRAPSNSLSDRLRRRTVSGPTPATKTPPPNGEDPLKRMKNDLQVTSLLLNKLRGMHSQASVQHANGRSSTAGERPSHRRAASAMVFTGAHSHIDNVCRHEVNPVKLVDPYIDGRRHGTEFHQIMNHGLLLNPVAREERGRSRTHSDAAVQTQTDGGRRPPPPHHPQPTDPRLPGKRGRYASDAPCPQSFQRQPIHVRHTSSAPATSSSKRKQEEEPVIFGNFRNPAQFPATVHLSVPSRHSSRDRGPEQSRDREGVKEKEPEKERQRAKLRRKRRESAPTQTLTTHPDKIVPIDSDDSGYQSTTRKPSRDRKSSSSKKHAPTSLPLDDLPGMGISAEAVARGLSMTKSEKSDRRVRFRGGADSIITTPAS